MKKELTQEQKDDKVLKEYNRLKKRKDKEDNESTLAAMRPYALTVEGRKELAKSIRVLCKSRESLTDQVTIMNNRIGKTKGNKLQKIDHSQRIILLSDKTLIEALIKKLKQEIRVLDHKILDTISLFPIYIHFLKHIRGIDTINSAILISYIDIHKADTISKITQYAGFNPSLVPGTKMITKGNYKASMGPIIKENEVKVQGKMSAYIFYKTNEMIRGDKKTKGFVSPFNGDLRSKLVMIGHCFILSNSPYKVIYNNRKHQKENSDKLVWTVTSKGKVQKKWKDVSAGHRANDARRYMLKQFIKDYYLAARQLEGLPFREPYEVEYLGHKHSGDANVCKLEDFIEIEKENMNENKAI